MFSIITQMILSLVFFTSPATPCYTKQITNTGYKITVKVNAYADSTCYLAHHYGQYNGIDDTATVNAQGILVFEGDKPLPGGTYIVVFPKKRYFEFIINKEQQIYFETDTSDFTKSMKIKGSTENRLFFDYLIFVNNNQYIYNQLKVRLDKNIGNNDSIAIIKKEISIIDDKIKNYKNDFIKKYPDTFVTKIFTSSKDVDMPEIPILSNGRKDSIFEYTYFKKHYWDNIDFNDDRILRTPIFYNKLNFYIENVIIQHPDSICNEVDFLIGKASGNSEMFKYLVAWLTYHFETSKIIGFDAVFVHLVEKYYMTNQCYWMSPKLLENISKKANKLKPILLGKVAPNMVMQDTNLQLVSMHSIKARYTIILFWDYECGHCKTEMPKVVELYNQKKVELGLEIYAVCTDTSMKEMKKFIRKNQMNFINVNGPRAITPHYSETYDIYSTPVIYLLDEKKAIISKRIEVHQVEEIINHDKMLIDKKLK